MWRNWRGFLLGLRCRNQERRPVAIGQAASLTASGDAHSSATNSNISSSYSRGYALNRIPLQRVSTILRGCRPPIRNLASRFKGESGTVSTALGQATRLGRGPVRGPRPRRPAAIRGGALLLSHARNKSLRPGFGRGFSLSAAVLHFDLHQERASPAPTCPTPARWSNDAAISATKEDFP